jgi:non-specific serine/threonine protein kinase
MKSSLENVVAWPDAAWCSRPCCGSSRSASIQPADRGQRLHPTTAASFSAREFAKSWPNARSLVSPFREIIDPLADHLATVLAARLVLHAGRESGSEKEIVARFLEDDGPPFCGVAQGRQGLNLTRLRMSSILTAGGTRRREQATDRAFRIGQKRNVLVHKFITSGTVEERIDQLIAEKRHLADEVLSGGGEVNLTELPDDELLQLVRLDVTRAAM